MRALREMDIIIVEKASDATFAKASVDVEATITSTEEGTFEMIKSRSSVSISLRLVKKFRQPPRKMEKVEMVDLQSFQ